MSSLTFYKPVFFTDLACEYCSEMSSVFGTITYFGLRINLKYYENTYHQASMNRSMLLRKCQF